MREDGKPYLESVHEKRTPLAVECLAGMIVAMDAGDMREVTRLFDIAMNDRFEAGIEYAKDTVGEWNRPVSP